MQNKNLIIGVVVVLLLVVVFVVVGNKPEAEAPAVDNGGVSNTMPVPGTDTTDMVAEGTVQETKEFTIEGTNFSFIPNNLTVNKGDKVRIIFKNTEGTHDFVIDEFNIKTAKLNAPGEEVVEFVASQTGNFEFYCSVGSHRAMGMKGMLVVQ